LGGKLVLEALGDAQEEGEVLVGGSCVLEEGGLGVEVAAGAGVEAKDSLAEGQVDLLLEGVPEGGGLVCTQALEGGGESLGGVLEQGVFLLEMLDVLEQGRLVGGHCGQLGLQDMHPAGQVRIPVGVAVAALHGCGL
jgi:hypothetical protein